MRRVGLLVLAAWSIAASPTAQAAERCSLPGETFIAKSAQAQLFSVKANGRKGVQRRYFGCRLGRRPLLLTADITPKSADDTTYRNDTFRIGGTWAAWVQRTGSHSGAGESSTAIHVRSLAGARRAVDVFTQA